MIASTATESTLGTMASSMKVGGKMESSTEKESTERMAATEKEFGKTARESNGSVKMAQPHKVNDIQT